VTDAFVTTAVYPNHSSAERIAAELSTESLRFQTVYDEIRLEENQIVLTFSNRRMVTFDVSEWGSIEVLTLPVIEA
jgi:hypothetical protein